MVDTGNTNGNTNLCLVDECQCRSVRHGSSYRDIERDKYAVYRIAIANSNIADFLQESLKEKKYIYIRHGDITKAMDESSSRNSPPCVYFQKRSYFTIYRALRHVLRPYNLLVSMGEHNNGDRLLVIRNVSDENGNKTGNRNGN